MQLSALVGAGQGQFTTDRLSTALQVLQASAVMVAPGLEATIIV
jgi:hypothetical protein